MTTTATPPSVTKNEANGKRKTKVGALWKRTGATGTIFFTGEITVPDDVDPLTGKVNVIAFVRRASEKKDSGGNYKNYPDIDIFISDLPQRGAKAISQEPTKQTSNTSQPVVSESVTDDIDL